MSLKLSGLNPLSYMGVEPSQPPQFVIFNVNPTINNVNFNIGTLWLNYALQNIYMLVNLEKGIATWILFSGNLHFLTSNSGGPVGPDSSNNINVVGDGTTITGVGNPGTHTITLSTVGTGVINTLTGNTGGAVSPAAGNINVVGDGVTVAVAGNPGTHTLTISTMGTGTVESLTTDDGHVVTPTAGTIILHGTHGLNTTGTVGPNTATVAINNAITLGDLVTLNPGTAALTATTGDIFLSASTATAATNPKIVFGSSDNHISFIFNNVFIGSGAGNATLTQGVAVFNIGIGAFACASLTTGAQNDAIGNGALQNATTANNNIAFGYVSLNAVTTASNNTAIGSTSFSGITTGSYNTALGASVGANCVTGTESSDIYIGYSVGVNAESNAIRIGTSGTGNGQQNKCWIAGIRGITTVNADAVAVLIDSTGQLGTVSSSRRYKENINDIGSQSAAIYDLRPVTFNYKNHAAEELSIGLIAEEVDEILPQLVVYDVEGKPDTIKYHELPVLLLNEIIKLKKEIEELKKLN